MSHTTLITGGTGFAGSHLVELLLKETAEEIHVTSFSDRKSFVHTLLPETQIHLVDLTNRKKVFELIEELKPSKIYHLAAISEVGKSFEAASEIINNNTILQLNVLEAVREIVPQARVLIVGSAQEYDLIKGLGDRVQGQIDENHPLGPANPYGVSKVSQDLLGLSYFYAYGLDIVRVRPFNHVGERQTPGFVISDFAQAIVKIERAEQDELQVGNLEAIRDFSDVKDIVAGYKLLLEKGEAGEVYNLGSGMGQSVNQVLELMKSLAIVEIPLKVAQNRLRPVDVKMIVADNSKILSLGWQPQFQLKHTLERVLNYWRQQ